MSQTWLITGANRGIGLEYARQLLKRGDRVIATAREPAAASELNALAKQHGQLLQVQALDTGNAASIAALAQRLADQPIDVLVNNAGLYGGSWDTDAARQTASGMDYALWEDIHRVNVMGPFRMIVALLPNLKLGARRWVVNMSSDLGSITNNKQGQSHAYRTSKAALNMLTRGLAIDLASEGIRLISMAPGWTKTDLGGTHAHWDVDASVTRQLHVIAALTPGDSGRFVNLLGESVAW
jgi:NAD(P)-dependent dehydrogenase (short-subunit alcohol dehydrogenase family)